MCGAISVPCETEGCERFTKEAFCSRCKTNMNHLTGV